MSARLVQLSLDDLTACAGEALPRDAASADAHWALLTDGHASARCALWWTETPAMPGQRLGLIGHYAAVTDGAAAPLLARACAELAARGCTLAVGPMDGNTLRHYRFLTERGTEPPFFLEPDNPGAWPMQWEMVGFTPLATYFSALNADLTREDPRAARAGARLADAGVTIRALNPDDFAGELHRIYAVAAVCFRENFLASPFTEAEFLALYEPIREAIRPELAFLAEQGKRPVGFCFNLPDLCQARHGAPIDTLILKTVAALPERACAGLGSVLVNHTHVMAREHGFRRVIHALMHETNFSLNISRLCAVPFRRYTLYARPLTP